MKDSEKISQARRDFLKMSLLGGAGVATQALVPSAIRRAMALPANNRTGTILDVEHVVIHMQENRSFDHYFGMLNGVRGFGDPRPVRLPGGRSVWQQPSSEHKDGYVMPFHGDTAVTRAMTVKGSEQLHQDNLTILAKGRYDKWGDSGELHKRMVYYTGQDLAYYYALAGAFTVCDQYFCSTLTQTYPNRLHLWTGCNGGGKVGGDPNMTNNGTHQTPVADMAEDLPFDGYTWTTYAERLQRAGVSWKVYQEYDNFNDNILALFANFRNIRKTSPLYERGRSWVSEHDPDPANRKRSDGQQLVAAFRRDLAAGTLPQVSWIVTAKDLSEHPSHVPVSGQNVTAQLVEALVDHPEMFAKTAFIINYDEVGGMFDHVPPPLPLMEGDAGYSSVSSAGEIKMYKPGGGTKKHPEPNVGPQPVGLGMRVPAMVVSPWSRGGWVCSEVFDHTSTLRFLETRFGVRAENISDWRRAMCGDLTSTFDFKDPNRDWASMTLPSTADYLARIARSAEGVTVTIPEVQRASDQDAEQRYARPLPYELSVDAKEDGQGRLTIDFANRGSAGVQFQVYDHTDRGGPWRYTLEAGKTHVATLSDGAGYELAVHGPNGFYRYFRGHAGAGLGAGGGGGDLVVTAAEDAARGALVLRMRNGGAKARKVAVAQAEVYRMAAGDKRRREYELQPGGTVESVWQLAASDQWYDLSVTLEGAEGFLYRYAGHVETGRASRTDPAIGAMRLQTA